MKMILLAALVGLLAQPGLAHDGFNQDFDADFRLEAEDFDYGWPACDPTPAGAHDGPRPDASASAGFVAVLPATNCFFHYYAQLPGPALLTSVAFRLETDGGDVPTLGQVSIKVDAVTTRALFASTFANGIEDYVLSPPLPISAGFVNLHVAYRLVNGPENWPMHLDFYQAQPLMSG